MIETTNQMIYLDAPGLAAKHVPLVALNPGIFQQHRRARALDGTLFEALQQETLQLLQRSHVGSSSPNIIGDRYNIYIRI